MDRAPAEDKDVDYEEEDFAHGWVATFNAEVCHEVMSSEIVRRESLTEGLILFLLLTGVID